MAEDQYIEESDDLFEHHRIVADPNQGPLRVDKFLMDKLSNVTRSRIQVGIKDGFVKVNEQAVKANYKVRMSRPPLQRIVTGQPIATVYKPAGMVVHPAYNNWTGTLVNALTWHFQHLPEMKGNEGRPGLVHRIDKDTSGLLVIAKTEEAMTGLAKQFFDHSIERTYYALVWGEMDAEGTIDVNLGRSLKDRRVTTAFPEGDFGRWAVTHYKLIKPLRYVSLVQCNLETGRTHQIRAHLKYIGHPLFNDATYGGDRVVKGTQFSKYKSFVQNCFKIIPRQALHAKSLGFIHPVTKEHMQFDSELPEDFKQVLEKWENYVQYE